MGALLEAANRGIKVHTGRRLLKAGLLWNGITYFYALSSHENIEVKIYNPEANPLTPWKMMGRMHDKYLIAR